LRHGNEAGGLSGVPLRSRATQVIAWLAEELGGAIPIIGVGGISSGADAREKIAAGATLVQFYTGMVYRGPELVGRVRQRARRQLITPQIPRSCRDHCWLGSNSTSITPANQTSSAAESATGHRSRPHTNPL
jgi:2,4-dienoyl-CoA reductase-like NADH-dependent reductase (Old Yellow Enzyme family)